MTSSPAQTLSDTPFLNLFLPYLVIKYIRFYISVLFPYWDFKFLMNKNYFPIFFIL